MTSLFTHAHARASDPATSHEAARLAETGAATDTDLAVRLVRLVPGQTAGELATLPQWGRPAYELRKRLADGAKRHDIEPRASRVCTVERTRQQTWYPKETT